MTKSINKDTVKQIRAGLAPLEAALPVDFDHCEQALKYYFDFYSFAEIAEGKNCHYRIGYLEIDSTRLVAHYWQLPEAACTVFIAHGLFDHVGIYLKLVDLLLKNGFSVLAVDMPGHGLSEGKAAEVEDFNRYSDAIIECLKILPADATVYGLGQSAGGSAIMQYVFNTGEACRFSKITLLAPLIRPSQWPLVNISYIMLCPFISLFPRSFTSNSHDKDFVEFLRNDPLQPRHISLRWMGAMRDWIKRFGDYSVSSIPTLIVQGTNDKTVDWKNNLPLIQKQFSNTQVVTVEEGRHHLVNEGDAWREQVFGSVVDFLKDSRGG